MAPPDEGAFRHESQATLINSLAIIFASLSTIAVFLRLYTRLRILNVFGADDVMIALAQVLAIATSVTTVLEAKYGLGRHTKFVPAGDALKQLKLLYANIMIYNASQILTKVSFLILYRRLFPSVRIQKVCFWLMICIAFWGITQEFIVGFSCTPLTSFLPSMEGKCIYTLPVWYLTSCMNIVTDFVVFLIPVIPVLKLHMGSKQKGMLLGLFCLGFFTCIMSLVRLSTLHKGINTQDPFWDNAPAAYWSVVELNCGIICACLPTLRPLIQKITPHLLSTGPRTGTNTNFSNELDRFPKHDTQTNKDVEHGIFVQKDLEVHSTTELRTSLGYAPSLDSTSNKTTPEGQQVRQAI
ncbi:hypothetical protein BU24DRAFT_149608 [Aaosphaeria arxii CBS 175.79]|uniref:Rhodopsin domain-containing protein n=1 Tax=Aaosphaeria arxii CBS 175.79 TaxID=1450172 RepID=A0A6A5XWP7_9PLEO|nr:uncharacterized protein BU24DRAFT_149608 [Aaosphaeria arxii CBS 175.79]KAF2017379.1 hypothetical protein BU24DRAFT_149608 [Aaosphaeria arxii CBS 175.79]